MHFYIFLRNHPLAPGTYTYFQTTIKGLVRLSHFILKGWYTPELMACSNAAMFSSLKMLKFRSNPFLVSFCFGVWLKICTCTLGSIIVFTKSIALPNRNLLFFQSNARTHLFRIDIWLHLVPRIESGKISASARRNWTTGGIYATP